MEKLFSKLDLVDYAASFKHFLARPKPLYMEGDANLHYKLIHELLTKDRLKPLPEVPSLDIPLAHLSKMGVLRLSEIFAFVQIVNYMSYLKTVLVDKSLGEWIERIVIPAEITQICGYFDVKGEHKPSVDEQFSSIAHIEHGNLILPYGHHHFCPGSIVFILIRSRLHRILVQ